MKKRRSLSLLLAILMVTALLPSSAMAADKNKTVTVKETASIGGKAVNVTVKNVPADTKLKLSGTKTGAWKDAVDKAAGGEYETVLAVNVKVSPSLKKASKVTLTAAAVKGLKASGIRVYRVADGTAKKIKDFTLKGKDLSFETKAFGIFVIVKPVTAAPEAPEEPAEPAAPVKKSGVNLLVVALGALAVGIITGAALLIRKVLRDDDDDEEDAPDEEK